MYGQKYNRFSPYDISILVEEIDIVAIEMWRSNSGLLSVELNITHSEDDSIISSWLIHDVGSSEVSISPPPSKCYNHGKSHANENNVGCIMHGLLSLFQCQTDSTL